MDGFFNKIIIFFDGWKWIHSYAYIVFLISLLKFYIDLFSSECKQYRMGGQSGWEEGSEVQVSPRPVFLKLCTSKVIPRVPQNPVAVFVTQ